MSFLPNLIKDTKLTNITMKNTQMFPATISSAVKLINYKNIAPAPPATTTTTTTTFKAIAPAPTLSGEGVKNMRKYTPRANNNYTTTNIQKATIGGGGAPYAVDQTQSVQRRNARERNRVKQVNNSFARLRQHLPKEIVHELTKGGGRGPQKKISKVDTLRIAVEYISRLEDYVQDLSGGDLNANSKQAATPTSSAPQVYVTQDFMQQQQNLSQLPPQLQQQQYHSTLLTPVSLAAFSPLPTSKVDISCHSPTASYISNTSFDSGTYEPAQQLSPEPFASEPVANGGGGGGHPNLALKFEPYDNFRLDEEDCTPDDDEIIDYISLWQEEQQASQN